MLLPLRYSSNQNLSNLEFSEQRNYSSPVLGEVPNGRRGLIVGAGSARPCIPQQFLTLQLLIFILFQVFLFVLFGRKKDEKRPAQSRKSFKSFARKLLRNITRSTCSCRSCLNVPILGTVELAFHALPSSLYSTAQTSTVLFPPLELTLTVAQHHAGVVLKITPAGFYG